MSKDEKYRKLSGDEKYTHSVLGRKRRRLVVILLAIGIFVSCCFFVGFAALRNKNFSHSMDLQSEDDVRIGSVRLRIPSQFYRHPHTNDNVGSGGTDSVSVILDLKTWFNPEPTANSEYIAEVRVNIDGVRAENVTQMEKVANGPWKSVEDRPEIKLREYVSLEDDGGWGYRTYVPIDVMVKTPSGGPLIYFCAGRPGQSPERCRTQYQHAKGLYVEYYLSSMLLPRWKEVHEEVSRVVSSFLIDKGSK